METLANLCKLERVARPHASDQSGCFPVILAAEQRVCRSVLFQGVSLRFIELTVREKLLGLYNCLP